MRDEAATDGRHAALAHDARSFVPFPAGDAGPPLVARLDSLPDEKGATQALPSGHRPLRTPFFIGIAR